MEWRIVVLFLTAFSLQSSDAQSSRSRSQSPTAEHKISPKDLPTEKQPFYLTVNNKFWPFNGLGELVFHNNDQIKLYCETGFSYPKLRDTTITLTYKNGKFQQGTTDYQFKDIICNKSPTVTSREVKDPGNCQGSKLYDIGYQIPGQFIPVYQSCFDHSAEIAKYSKHTVLPGSINRKKITGKFTDVTSIGTFAEFYSKMDSKFDPGHLAPVGDFLYAVQQQATFVYPNVAPQWKNFNSDQWSDLERQIRSNQYNREFVSYTGVLGVMAVDGKEKMYLDKVGKKIPVPEWFFKVLYEPLSQRAVVFIGANDRLSKAKPKPICTSVRDNLQGFRFKGVKEYLYACEYADFRQQANAQYLPALNVHGLLFGK